MQMENKNCTNEPRRGATKVGSGDLPEDGRHTIFETENHRGCCTARYTAAECISMSRSSQTSINYVWNDMIFV